MKKLAVVALILSSAAAGLAQAPNDAPAAARTEVNGDPNQIVCVRENRIGSRLSTARVCRTRAEWAELRSQQRQVVEKVQQFQQNCAPPNPC